MKLKRSTRFRCNVNASLAWPRLIYQPKDTKNVVATCQSEEVRITLSLSDVICDSSFKLCYLKFFNWKLTKSSSEYSSLHSLHFIAIQSGALKAGRRQQTTNKCILLIQIYDCLRCISSLQDTHTHMERSAQIIRQRNCCLLCIQHSVMKDINSLAFNLYA